MIRVSPPDRQPFDLDEELGFIETTLRVSAWIALTWAVMAIVFAVVVNVSSGSFVMLFLNAPWALGTGVLSLVISSLAFAGVSNALLRFLLLDARRRRSDRRMLQVNEMLAQQLTNLFRRLKTLVEVFSQ